MNAVVSQLMSESLIGLNAAARRLPPGRCGKPVTFSCVLRWVQQGVPGPDGERVKLEAVRLGGRWLTSLEALARFAARLTPRLDTQPAAGPGTLKQRQRANARAEKALREKGI
jgi:hypothetical protein